MSGKTLQCECWVCRVVRGSQEPVTHSGLPADCIAPSPPVDEAFERNRRLLDARTDLARAARRALGVGMGADEIVDLVRKEISDER